MLYTGLVMISLSQESVFILDFQYALWLFIKHWTCFF